MEGDEARGFFRRYFGADWEERLLSLGALLGPDATNEESYAAEQRAVDLVSESVDDWTLVTREFVAAAWHALWAK
ncbi:MAG: hypothetical protein ABIQ73_05860 [Acidimicrobiales bacterium]